MSGKGGVSQGSDNKEAPSPLPPLVLGPCDTKEKSSHVPSAAFPRDPEAVTEEELRASFHPSWDGFVVFPGV